ncbi:MAG: exosortase H-associated membrane protein [Thiofilum sp.]|uniref:exosortase H-associated membrane protein n=1 Tax=Thiofilum sp. TaxID=2212733 RepID=UPI0025D06B1B|nr:exosortase H-associated membrane protein [Thiofilum sp.]MBK8453200.1 hypothetical protein [Thiofilum sp.]
MKTQIISHFIIKVLGYLVLTFALWYYLATWHLAPLVALAHVMMSAWLPDFIMWVKLQGTTVIVATQYGFDVAGLLVTPPSLEAAGFTLNPLSFGYGLPLFSALLLATPVSDKGLRLVVGSLILMGLQLLSLLVSILKALTFELDPALQQALQWSTWQLDMIALTYQIGFLLLPMIAPLIIWALLSQAFLIQLAPQLQGLHRLPSEQQN